MRKFEISQKFWSLAGKFDIFDEDGRLAYQVQGSFLKLFKEFTIFDGQGKTVSHIKQQFSFPFQKFMAIGALFVIDGVVAAPGAKIICVIAR